MPRNHKRTLPDKMAVSSVVFYFAERRLYFDG
nr:MAG TPA: hypothetical protein [Caudoviricetes sp.]